MGSPKLSTLHSPLELMGKTAVSLLMENIKLRNAGNKKQITAKHIPLAKTFIDRESIGPCPKPKKLQP